MKHIVFLFIVVISFAYADEDPIVETADGKVRGTKNTTDEGVEIFSFRGIPYGQPPSGENRFLAPEPVTSWSGTLNATSYSNMCKQYNPIAKAVVGSEDCLYLNVFTPNVTEGSKLPVLVFIHGGAFLFGGGSMYEGFTLLKSKMVVMTFNYRMGPLGFLSTGDTVVPGNAGLKDQVLALKWVQKNIEKFGGDPDNVTVLGHATGSASLHLHYLSPQSKGTFARGIMMSGTAFDQWCYMSNPAKQAAKLATLLGCSADSSSDILTCLNEADADDIVTAQMEFVSWDVNLFSPFGPTVESSEVEDYFLNEYPYTATVNGCMQKLPLIISYTAQDGLYPGAAFMAADGMLSTLNDNWSEQASDLFKYNETLTNASDSAAVAEKIKTYYMDGSDISEETFPNFIQALTERNFMINAVELARLHASLTENNVQFIKYNTRGNFSLTQVLASNDNDYGVSHGDDLLHVFAAFDLDTTSAIDTAMKDVLINYIFKYATNGVAEISDDVPWTAVPANSEAIPCMVVSSPTSFEMVNVSNTEAAKFWESFGFNENANYKA